MSLKNHQRFLKEVKKFLQENYPDIIIIAQYCGVFSTMQGRQITMGIPGLADLIFFLSVDGMKGKFLIGGFIEIKTGSGRLSDVQAHFKERVEKLGGIFIVARDLDKLREDLNAGISRYFRNNRALYF